MHQTLILFSNYKDDAPGIFHYTKICRLYLKERTQTLNCKTFVNRENCVMLCFSQHCSSYTILHFLQWLSELWKGRISYYRAQILGTFWSLDLRSQELITFFFWIGLGDCICVECIIFWFDKNACCRMRSWDAIDELQKLLCINQMMLSLLRAETWFVLECVLQQKNYSYNCAYAAFITLMFCSVYA